MATILDKDLVRESTIQVGGREIQVTLGADQTISMKLKGMKSGTVSMSIEELYQQLTGGEIEDDVSELKPISVPTGGIKKSAGADPMISLHDIRHGLNIAGFEYPVLAKFDTVMSNLIEDAKKR